MEKQNIYLVEFPNDDSVAMAATFLRFQEYYESPQFKGKIFSFGEFVDWSIKTKGDFTYFWDYDGFNIPGYILKPFYERKFDPLTYDEKKLLKIFEDRFKQNEWDFYIIALTKPISLRVLKHEFLHALFYLYFEYADAVRNCIRQFNLAVHTSKIRKAILEYGDYDENVLSDEINAYIMANVNVLDGITEADVKIPKRALSRIFKQYFGYSLGEKTLPFMIQQVSVVR